MKHNQSEIEARNIELGIIYGVLNDIKIILGGCVCSCCCGRCACW
jgi:hypothetical protein